MLSPSAFHEINFALNLDCGINGEGLEKNF
jgi:hypothetical protein